MLDQVGGRTRSPALRSSAAEHRATNPDAEVRLLSGAIASHTSALRGASYAQPLPPMTEDLQLQPIDSSAHDVPPAFAIRMRGFVKRFGPITAVAGLDLDVPAGSCVGLLGPNGAGKSTTMKALTAQVIADEGDLEVLGYALPADSKQARAQMGVVPQLDNLDVALTVEQNLLVFAHLYRVPGRDREDA